MKAAAFRPLVVGQAWPATVEESYVQYRNLLLRPRRPKVILQLTPEQIRTQNDSRRAFRERFERETGLDVDSIQRRSNQTGSLDELNALLAQKKAEVAA